MIGLLGRGSGAGRGVSRRTAALLIVLPVTLALSLDSSRGDDPGQLNLFQRAARAQLIVHVRVRDGALRYALVDVLETLKGESQDARLRIAFRDFNFDRPRGEEPIVFLNGEEEILFLVPYSRAPRSEKKREKYRDVFELLLGSQGRLKVPAEGAGATFDAIRRLVAIAGRDPASQSEGLRDLLGGGNPALVEAALEEITRLRVAGPALYPKLIGLLASPSPTLRLGSLRLMQQVFADSGRAHPESTDQAIVEADQALASVLERARNDPDEQVRVAGVAALAAWPERSQVEGDLRAIARQDPAQAVRFEAERALYRERGR